MTVHYKPFCVYLQKKFQSIQIIISFQRKVAGCKITRKVPQKKCCAKSKESKKSKTSSQQEEKKRSQEEELQRSFANCRHWTAVKKDGAFLARKKARIKDKREANISTLWVKIRHDPQYVTL